MPQARRAFTRSPSSIHTWVHFNKIYRKALNQTICTISTLCCICLRSCCLGLETGVIIKISTHPCYSKTLTWSKKKIKKIKIFFSKWLTQKSEIFKTTNYRINFPKIGPWDSKVDWCKRHIETVRCKLKHRQKILFLSLHWTASQPYRLSHINAVCINQFY
jgi:hypothetical protein